MPKPLGVVIRTSERGLEIGLSSTSGVEDAIWNAVESAIDNGWTPEQFKNESAMAWKDRLKTDSDHAQKVLSR